MKNQALLLLLLLVILFASCRRCPDCPTQNTSNTDLTEVRIDTVFLTDTIMIPANTGTTDYKVPILSASVNNFYYQCGNTITLDIPDGWTDPKVSASSANVLPSQNDKRKFTIVPAGRTCFLSCQATTTDGSIHRWDRRFKVIRPPMPEIELLVNGKLHNGASPISKRSNCVIRVKPDADFRSLLPRDARYTISRVELLSQRSLGAPTKVGSYSGSGKDATRGIPVPLGNRLKSDPPGTKIYFKIDGIYRVNFQNKKLKEKFADRSLYVGAVVK